MSIAKDIHTEHCCLVHGCKYEEGDTCSVINGAPQSFPCEWCLEDLKDAGVSNLEKAKFNAIKLRARIDDLEEFIKKDYMDLLGKRASLSSRLYNGVTAYGVEADELKAELTPLEERLDDFEAILYGPGLDDMEERVKRLKGDRLIYYLSENKGHGAEEASKALNMSFQNILEFMIRPDFREQLQLAESLKSAERDLRANF